MAATAGHFPSSLKSLLIILLFQHLGTVVVRAHKHGVGGDQPLSKIAIHMAVFALQDSASIKAFPHLLGTKGEDAQWITVEINSLHPSEDDWVGIFSPAKFNSSDCPDPDESRVEAPYICSAPIKYKYANDSSSDYTKTGNGSLRFRLINQRADFSFALFAGGLSNPKLVAVSNILKFANPKAPLYPRLSQGKSWDEMTVTWTSGYNIYEAVPIVEWGIKGEYQTRSPAGTLTFNRNSMCERDGSNEYNDYQPGSLNTTDQLIKDRDNIDVVFHIGDMSYANGYISQWDQFTSQVEPIASTVPYMIARFAHACCRVYVVIFSLHPAAYLNMHFNISSGGNHERDSPGTGSFYDTDDSGGECGVLAETMFYVPAENRAKFWYSTDYGMFHFCIADTEHDWREGSEQYRFIENCFASADRQKQPWLIFAAHRPVGYSSGSYYGLQGSYEEPMGRESLQKLWQKYEVDIAFYGHVHNYERTCPIYQNQCVNKEKYNYSGVVNGTIHVVVGGGGSHLSEFSPVQTFWSLHKDYDYGFVKLTAFNHSSLLFEYKKGSDGKVYDSFTVSRDYKDVLACVRDGCEPTTLAI